MGTISPIAEAFGPGEDVVTVDGALPGQAGDIHYRSYRPDGDGPLPVLVYYHGGGWVAGDLDTHDHLCRMFFAGSGCLVVSIDYRLAPEHRFPAAVEDRLRPTSGSSRTHHRSVATRRVSGGGRRQCRWQSGSGRLFGRA